MGAENPRPRFAAVRQFNPRNSDTDSTSSPDDRKSFCISTFSRNSPGLGASGDEKCDRPTPANRRMFRSAKITLVKIEQNSRIVPVKKNATVGKLQTVIVISRSQPKI